MSFKAGIVQTVDDDGYAITAALFARALGIMALAVTVDLWRQIIPLCGARGIVPVSKKAQAHQRGGDKALSFVQFPTVCRWWYSDVSLHCQCALATAASLALALGLGPLPWLWNLLPVVILQRTFLDFSLAWIFIPANCFAIIP